MARTNKTGPVLESLNSQGALRIEGDTAKLTIQINDAEKPGEKKLVGLSLRDLIGLSEYSVDSLVRKADPLAASKSAYRKQSEKMLLGGLLPDAAFDMTFGEGEAAKVRGAAKPAEKPDPDAVNPAAVGLSVESVTQPAGEQGKKNGK